MHLQIENGNKLAVMARTAFKPSAGFIWALALLVLGVSSVQATTLLDPLPENSTTQFGFAATEVGDVNGDGVPDLAVAAPFQDGDFVSVNMGYGRPQNVGKIFILDGVTFSVLNMLNDPQFELIQPDHFGGLLGNSLSKVPDLNGDRINDI